MKQKLFGIMLIFAAIAFVGCKSEDEATVVTTTPTLDSRTATVNSSLVDIPSSVSSASSSSSASLHSSASIQRVYNTAPAGDEPVWAVYEGVRQNIGALEAWATMIEEFTESIWSVVGSDASGDWTNDNPSNGQATQIVWGPDDTHGYDSKMEFYWSGVKGFEAYLTVDQTEETAKGAYTWDFAVVPNSDDPSNDSKIQFIFDGTNISGTKVMEIKASNMNGSSSGAPEKAWLKATQDTDNVITLWGNYYFPTMNWFSDTTTDTRSYVFAAIGYDETGQTTELKNKAVLQLTLPPSDTTTDTYWTDSSVGQIFIEKIKEIWAGAGFTVSSINFWTGLSLSGPTIDDLTYSDVIAILQWAHDNSTDPGADNFDQLIYATKLVNNAYFDAGGFQGTCLDQDDNGVCEQGTATTVPTGFESLNINDVTADAPSPETVKDLMISFL